MVFFSTYRCSRLCSPTFFMGPVMRMRAFADFYFQRAWNGTLHWAIPGDMRLWIVCVPLIYYVHRWHNDHALESDAYEKAIIMRWGGTLEAARRLSPEDQLRARVFADLEKIFSAYGPKEAVVQPPGSELPGKDLYNKHGHAAH